VKVEVDADCCGGFGQCVTLCPDVFELTDAGYAVVLLPDVPAAFEAVVREAERACPTHAITVT
jgi:ferredoxin